MEGWPLSQVVVRHEFCLHFERETGNAPFVTGLFLMNLESDSRGEFRGEDFKTIFCRSHRCKPADYEQLCFVKNLFPHARLCVWLFHSKREIVFREDFELLRELASVTCPDTFRYEVNRFYGRNIREKSWLRRVFKIRLSGKKIRKMGASLLKGNPSSIPLFQAQAQLSIIGN
jgi:hypothetical protein